MSNLYTALVAVVALVVGACAPADAAPPLSLEQAFERTIQTHPELAALRYTQRSLAADVDRAAQAPALAVGASIENAFGTGTASGLSGAELTVSLSSLLER